MFIYTGQELKNFTESTVSESYKKRFLLKELSDYVLGDNNHKVCCLYGLRRTGKTIMMLQQIKDIDDYDQCLYVGCEFDEIFEPKESMASLKEKLLEHKDCKYLFIDEVTATKNFISTCAFLADQFAYPGKKVVLAGTDSLGFHIARENALYDRAVFIHTTYIPYKEYHYLTDKTLDEYITSGGVLSDDNILSSRKEVKKYSLSAIAYNIMHSLERWDRGRKYGIFDRMIRDKTLTDAINKIIEYHNGSFLASVINDDFTSHDLGSLADLLTRSTNINPDPIDTVAMSGRIRGYLGIKYAIPEYVNEECLEQLIEYLKEMDVLHEKPQQEGRKKTASKEYIFTQPGLRYAQAKSMADALMESDDFQVYSETKQKRILEKLYLDIKGGILEDILFYQTEQVLENDDIKVTKYRDKQGKEIDILIKDLKNETSIAIEVKHSDKIDERQRRHLLDDAFITEIENVTGAKIEKKAVIYEGETLEKQIDGVAYINAEDFLVNLEDYAKEFRLLL